MKRLVAGIGVLGWEEVRVGFPRTRAGTGCGYHLVCPVIRMANQAEPNMHIRVLLLCGRLYGGAQRESVSPGRMCSTSRRSLSQGFADGKHCPVSCGWLGPCSSEPRHWRVMCERKLLKHSCLT